MARFDWRDPDQLRATAIATWTRARAEHGLPAHIEDELALDRLATLLDDAPLNAGAAA